MNRFRGFVNSKGKATGVLFGFMRELLVLAQAFDSTEFAFVWDSRKSLRKLYYSGYKDRREVEKTPQDVRDERDGFKQFEELKDMVLPRLGFKNIFFQEGIEADDIIARICKTYPNRQVVILSNDNDLWQLLSKNHYMYSVKSKRKYTAEDFEGEWGLPPGRWAEVKAIAGCSGDKVKGVPGVGNKSAAQYLKGALKEHYKTYKNITSTAGKRIAKYNKFLVTLPLPATDYFRLSKEVEEKFRLEDFLYFWDEYEFNSLKAQEALWRERFNMRVGR